MKVLIDIPLQCTSDSLQQLYIQQLIRSIAQSSQHQLVLAIPKSSINHWKEVTGDLPVQLLTVNKKGWLRKGVYEKWTLPRLLHHAGINLLISTHQLLADQKEIKQLLLLDQQLFVDSAAYRKKINESKHLLVPAPYWNQLLNHSNPTTHITVQLPRLMDEVPAQDVIHAFKVRYSQNRDYFFVHSNEMDVATLTRLLKAYSIFKKFQQSGLQMIMSLPAKTISAFQPQYNSYKFKTDVHFIDCDTANQMKTAVAGAYATVFTDRKPVITAPMLWSLQAGIPMILPENECLQSAWSEQALFAENTEKGWATPLMLMYKDETLRQQLSDRCLSLAQQIQAQPMDIDQLFNTHR